jgi:hypothetical protein
MHALFRRRVSFLLFSNELLQMSGFVVFMAFLWFCYTYVSKCRLICGKPKSFQDQGCQMVYFHTKNPNLDIFWRALPRMENVGICYDHYIGIVLGDFLYVFYGHYISIICGHLVYFICFGMFGPRKIWHPLSGHDLLS